MVLGWVVFWLNTALFPCCEVLAAALSGQGRDVSPSISAAQPGHHPGDPHSGSPVHNSDAPCSDSLNPGTPLVGECQALTPDRSPAGFFAAVAPPTTLTAVTPLATLVLARAPPPPSLRLYLRTQRLLI